MCICIYIDGKLTKSYLLEFRLTSTKTMHGDFSDEKTCRITLFIVVSGDPENVWGFGNKNPSLRLSSESGFSKRR